MSIKAHPSVESAQAKLGLNNGFASDSEVLALFWTKYSSLPKESRGKSSNLAVDYVGALRTITIRQKSRLLLFVLTILPHLTDHNVGLLTNGSLPEWLVYRGAEAESQDAVPPVNKPNLDLIKPEPTDTGPTPNSNDTLQDVPPLQKADGTAPLASHDSDEELEKMRASPFTEESASSADIPSSSDEEPLEYLSDSSSDEHRKYYDGQKWRCEACMETLAECYCPDGHSDYQCAICGSDAADMEFCINCSKCHQSLEGPCSECQIPGDPKTEEDTEDPSELFWDDLEQVWRCALCFWEVEANKSNEGYCHCSSEQKPNRLRRIELAEYPDYSPADSDSSVADSTDSEPDSGDEEFIEDDGPFISSFVNMLAGNYDPFEKMTSSELEPMDTGGDA
ncbi:MAG: hypothetical protein LQ346_004055 [Caloplaca aetnensis]|nr:MAG: hypothetical protein LQ346_004055 [Caloplaca aetnensis]